jgi:DNA topoisomerase-1
MADGAALPTPAIEAPAGLTWCNDIEPGIRRRRSGKGFGYVGPDGQAVRDEKTLARIRALAIPPAWTDVWICPHADGHIQATGRDVKGRKQYRYHADWSEARSGHKFDRVAEFGRKLPRLRARIDADLSTRGVTRDKVVATAIRLLEITLIRVGNRQYAKQNRSYGLTTLTKRHLEVDGAAMRFSFRGKSGVEHRVTLRDRRLAPIVRSLRELPGQTLFKYRDADGTLCPITSDDVNRYIHEAMGEQFSAKDFRTWAGTVSAARALRDMEPPTSKADAKRKLNTCVKAVAGVLGNTPTVCRAAYVHPRVFELFEAGELPSALPGADTAGFEKALIRLLS